MDSEGVKEFRKKHKLTQSDLASIAGVGIRAVQTWEQGKRNISQSAIKLLEAYAKSPKNLSDVKYVSPYLVEKLVQVSYASVRSQASFVESLYGLGDYEEETYGVLAQEGEDLKDSKYKVFDIEGDSMYPTIQSGATILCEEIKEELWEYAKGVIVVVYGKTITVKRVLKNNLYIGNLLTLKADNPTYGELDIERCEIRGIWQAVRVINMRII